MKRMIFKNQTKIKTIINGETVETSFGVGEVVNLKWVEGQAEGNALIAESIPPFFNAITDNNNELCKVPLISVRWEF